jgi:hypothetical protein
MRVTMGLFKNPFKRKSEAKEWKVGRSADGRRIAVFKKKSKTSGWHLTLQLNARIMPIDRGDIFEDPIDNRLRELNIGEVDGGGTLLSAVGGEIEHCDVEICLNERSDASYGELLRIITDIGVPKGSFLISDDDEKETGELEGLALYLNGVDLDEEIYKTCDVNHLVSELIRTLGSEHNYTSYWEGAEETALYFYGRSFDKMKELITPLVDEYPLCQRSRIVQIS